MGYIGNLRIGSLTVALIFVVQLSFGQRQKGIVILTVKNSRWELAKAVEFLNANNPKLICISPFPEECEEGGDDKELSRHLIYSNFLLMPSKINRFEDDEYRDFVGCPYLYPTGVTTGFINLMCREDGSNQAEQFQVSNTFRDRVRYHFAVNIAFALNAERTRSFIKSHSNIVAIDFMRRRKLLTFNIESFYDKKIDKKILQGKVVIITDQSEEYYSVPQFLSEDGSVPKMSAAEIFANIACQIIGE